MAGRVIPARLALCGRLVALAATAFLLLAHSPTGDAGADCEGYPVERQAYSISGTCDGVAGRFELSAAAGSCDILVEGDAGPLPRVGRREASPGGRLDAGQFTLYDEQQPRGLTCTAEARPTSLVLECLDLATDTPCELELRPTQ